MRTLITINSLFHTAAVLLKLFTILLKLYCATQQVLLMAHKWERDQQTGQKDERKRKSTRSYDEDKTSEISSGLYDKWVKPMKKEEEKTTQGTPGGKYKESTTEEAISKYKHEMAGVWTDQGSDATSHNDGSWQIQR
jgi:hypothetical protein